MTRDEFKAEVDEFVRMYRMYCVDYFMDDKASWEFTDDDPDSFSAVIHLEAFLDHKYDMPICMERDRIVIDLSAHDCDGVALEPAEMFAWLWFQECKRSEELESQLGSRVRDLEELVHSIRSNG
jgi:hypothetical protein